MTKPNLMQKWWLAAAGVAIVGLAAGYFGIAARGSSASPVVGLVAQSGVTSASGVEIRLEHAVFSALEVSVGVRVTSPSLQGRAAIAPVDALLGETAAESAAISADGRVLLRFTGPIEAVGREPSQVLTIRAVQVIREDGTFSSLAGPWVLSVALPEGEAATEAAAATALGPSTLMLGNTPMVIEGFRASETILLIYQLPGGALQPKPPTIAVDGRRYEPARATHSGTLHQVWFASVPAGPLLVEFDALSIPDESDPGAVAEISIDDFELPAGSDSAEVEKYPVPWSQVPVSGGSVEVVDVAVLRHPLGRESMFITIAGIWNPETGKPRVVAGGAELFVRGVGLTPGQNGLSAQTTIEADIMGGAELPKTLTLIVEGRSLSLTDLRVSLGAK